MKKRLKTRYALPALLIFGLLSANLPASAQYGADQPAAARQSQEVEGGGQKVIYLFSTDFPPAPIGVSPSPPVAETRFWQLLDEEMRKTGALSLTENMEEADYRVELRCAGITHCSKLRVDVQSPARDVLSSFNIQEVLPYKGIFGGKPRLEKVAHDLATRLDERIKLLKQGGYGYTE